MLFVRVEVKCWGARVKGAGCARVGVGMTIQDGIKAG